jgi:hypothetical protein
MVRFGHAVLVKAVRVEYVASLGERTNSLVSYRSPPGVGVLVRARSAVHRVRLRPDAKLIQG